MSKPQRKLGFTYKTPEDHVIALYGASDGMSLVWASDSESYYIDALSIGPVTSIDSLTYDGTTVSTEDSTQTGPWTFPKSIFNHHDGSYESKPWSGNYPYVERTTTLGINADIKEVRTPTVTSFTKSVSGVGVKGISVAFNTPSFTQRDTKNRSKDAQAVFKLEVLDPAGSVVSTKQISAKYYCKNPTSVSLYITPPIGYEDTVWDYKVTMTIIGIRYSKAVSGSWSASTVTELFQDSQTYNNIAYSSGMVSSTDVSGKIPVRLYSGSWYKVDVPIMEDVLGVPTFLGNFTKETSDSHAWNVLSVLTDSKWAGDIPIDKINMDSLLAFEDYCAEIVNGRRRHTFSQHIIKPTNFFKLASQMVGTADAKLYEDTTGRVGIIIDQQTDQRRSITSYDLIDERVKRTTIPDAKRFNYIQAEFDDEDNKYEKTIIFVEDPESIIINGVIKKEIKLDTCTNREEAERSIKRLLAVSQNIPDTYQLKVGNSHEDIQIGEILEVYDRKHANINYCGKIGSGSTATVIQINPNTPVDLSGIDGSQMDVAIWNGTQVLRGTISPQEDTIDTIVANNSSTYSITINGTLATYTSDIDATIPEITAGLTSAINLLAEPVTATDNTSSVSILSDSTGDAFISIVTAGSMVVSNTISKWSNSQLTLTSPLSEVPAEFTSIGISQVTGNTLYPTLMKVADVEDSKNEISVGCVAYNHSIYPHVDTGTSVINPITRYITPPADSSVIYSLTFTQSGDNLRATWGILNNYNYNYTLYIKETDDLGVTSWKFLESGNKPSATLLVDFPFPLHSGDYKFVISAVSLDGLTTGEPAVALYTLPISAGGILAAPDSLGVLHKGTPDVINAVYENREFIVGWTATDPSNLIYEFSLEIVQGGTTLTAPIRDGTVRDYRVTEESLTNIFGNGYLRDWTINIYPVDDSLKKGGLATAGIGNLPAQAPNIVVNSNGDVALSSGSAIPSDVVTASMYIWESADVNSLRPIDAFESHSLNLTANTMEEGFLVFDNRSYVFQVGWVDSFGEGEVNWTRSLETFTDTVIIPEIPTPLQVVPLSETSVSIRFLHDAVSLASIKCEYREPTHLLGAPWTEHGAVFAFPMVGGETDRGYDDATDEGYIVISGLTKGILYEFQMRAANVASVYSEYSDIVTGTPDIPKGQSNITLIPSVNVIVEGNRAYLRSGVTVAWDEQVYSKESYVSGCSVGCVIGNTEQFMLGLNQDPVTDAHYNSIDYCFYVATFDRLFTYESGVGLDLEVTWATGDTLQIVYDNVNIKYIHNGIVVKTTSVLANLKFYVDSSFSGTNISIDNITFQPFSSQLWDDVGGIGKPTDNADVALPLLEQASYINLLDPSWWGSIAYAKHGLISSGGVTNSAAVPLSDYGLKVGDKVTFSMNITALSSPVNPSLIIRSVDDADATVGGASVAVSAVGEISVSHTILATATRILVRTNTDGGTFTGEKASVNRGYYPLIPLRDYGTRLYDINDILNLDFSEINGVTRPTDYADVTGSNTALDTANIGAYSAASAVDYLGRSADGFAANGDVARPLPVAIADSSNILRYEGGELYKGSLKATENAAMNMGSAMDSLDKWFATYDETTALGAGFTIETITDGVAGDKCLQLVDNDDAIEYFFSELMPVNENKTYKASIIVRQPSGDRENYLLVNFADGSKINITGTLGGATGWVALGDYHYFSITDVTFSTTFTKYEIVFGAQGDATIPAGAKFCNIGALLSRAGAVGTNTTIQIQDFKLEELVGDYYQTIVGAGLLSDSIAIKQAINSTTYRTASMGLAPSNARDGDAVTFSPVWDMIPTLTPAGGGLTYDSVTLTGAQARDVKAINMTTSGFDFYAKLKEVAGSVVPVTDTGASSAGTQDWEMDKSSASQAFDDQYTFQIDIDIDNVDIGGGDYDPGSVSVGFYTASTSGTWVKRATVTYNGTAGDPTTNLLNQTYTITVDGLTNHAGKELGVNVESTTAGGTISSFDNVKYSTATTPTDTPATPTGVSSINYTIQGGL